MLSVTYKLFMLSVIMLSAIMLSAIMLSGVAPWKWLQAVCLKTNGVKAKNISMP
jgi:hypothetical protein